jgi:hypothetical protein
VPVSSRRLLQALRGHGGLHGSAGLDASAELTNVRPARKIDAEVWGTAQHHKHICISDRKIRAGEVSAPVRERCFDDVKLAADIRDRRLSRLGG